MLKTTALITSGLIITSSVLSYFHVQDLNKGQKLAFGQTAFTEFIPENLESIVIQHADNTIQFNRTVNYRWEVKGRPSNFPADEDKIRNFLMKLTSIRVGDVIPGGDRRPEVFGFSAMNDKEGAQQAGKAGSYVSLRGLNNVPLLELYLGKERKFGSGVYAKFAGRPEVYLILENFSEVNDWQFWLNKSILDIEEKEIAAIDFLMLKDTPRLERERSAADAPWKEVKKTTNGRILFSQTFRQETLPNLLDALQGLQFLHVVPKKSVANSSAHARGNLDKELVSKIGLQTFSGQYITITLYKHQGNEAIAASPYYASFQMTLRHSADIGKYGAITLVSDKEAFNHKSEPWFFVLDETSAKRFLVK